VCYVFLSAELGEAHREQSVKRSDEDNKDEKPDRSATATPGLETSSTMAILPQSTADSVVGLDRVGWKVCMSVSSHRAPAIPRD
jgi:hypothetical protein